MMPVVLIILVVIGTILLLFYLRKRTINRWVGYLEEAKSIINGEWLKFGKLLEGEYKGRKVQCGIFEDENAQPFLRMKPLTIDVTMNKYEWIDSRSFPLTLNFPSLLIHGGEYMVLDFFKKGHFIEELEKISQFCEKVEKGEAELK